MCERVSVYGRVFVMGRLLLHSSLEALVVESVASLSAYQVSNTSEYHGTKMRVLKRVGRWQHLQDKCLWLDSVLTECSYLHAACKCGWEIIPDVSVSVLICVITVICRFVIQADFQWCSITNLFWLASEPWVCFYHLLSAAKFIFFWVEFCMWGPSMYS